MPSTTRRARTSAWISLSTALALSACASAPPIVAQAPACSSLIPSSHRSPVPGAELPSLDATAGDWIVFADAQTGQLDKANGHTADVVEIIEACEARDREAVKRLKRPWWKLVG